jgi:hypothetical protein
MEEVAQEMESDYRDEEEEVGIGVCQQSEQ